MTWSVHVLSPISPAKAGCINDYAVQLRTLPIGLNSDFMSLTGEGLLLKLKLQYFGHRI